MSRLLARLAPVRDQRVVRLNGDQETLTFDTSYWREGALWACPPQAPLYVLVGSQLVMKYFSHNVAITEDGFFVGRDDTGACMLLTYGEDEVWRWFSAPSANKGTLPVWTQQKSMNAVTGLETWVGGISPSQTVGVIGTTTNNSANAGSVGEYLTATIATPGTTLTTATPVNVITAGLSLTAGDWDVWADCCLLPAATTSITQFSWGLSSTTGTLPAAGSGLGQWVEPATVPGAATPLCEVTCPIRVSQAGTAAVFLVASATFTVSTLSAFGTIRARRVR